MHSSGSPPLFTDQVSHTEQHLLHTYLTYFDNKKNIIMPSAVEEAEGEFYKLTIPSVLLERRRRVVFFGGTLAVALLLAVCAAFIRQNPLILHSSPAVTGNFRLDYDAGFAERACELITDQFVSTTECICSLDQRHTSSVSYGCRHSSMTCAGPICGNPTYTGSVSVDSRVAAPNYCLNSLHVGMDRVGTLCVSVTTLPHSNVLEKCKASMDGRMCSKCETCEGGTGIRLDCSRHGTHAVSTQCDAVGLLSAIKGEPNSIVDFVPSFQKQDS